MPAWLGNLSFC